MTGLSIRALARTPLRGRGGQIVKFGSYAFSRREAERGSHSARPPNPLCGPQDTHLLMPALAASAAAFSSWLTCTKSVLAFSAWPCISYLLSFCAAAIYLLASTTRRCASARLGCTFLLMSSTGSWAMVE